MVVQEPIQATIWHCLDHYAYSDAIFLAERLNAEIGSEESLYLLATCYYRANKKNQCYAVLSHKANINKLNSKCKFLLAKCCLEMQKLEEAEEILLSSKKCKDPIDSIVADFGESAPFASKLFASICLQADRLQCAKEAYIRSLKLNPFLWKSFCMLCKMGENVDPNILFQVSGLDNFNMCHGTQTYRVPFVPSNPDVCSVTNVSSSECQTRFLSTPRNPVKNMPQTEDLGVLHPSNKNRQIKSRNLFTSTPMGANSSFGFLPLETGNDSQEMMSSNPSLLSSINSPIMLQSSPLGADSNEPRSKKNCDNTVILYDKQQPCLRVPPSWQPQQQSAMLNGSSVISPTSQNNQMQVPQPLNSQPSNVRRSSRLFSNSNSNASVKENSKTPSRTRAQSSKSPGRKPKVKTPRSATVTSNNNNSTYQENQKNSHLNEDSFQSDQDMRYITPSPIEKSFAFPYKRIELQNNKIGSIAMPISPASLGSQPGSTMHQVIALQKRSAEGLMSLLRDMGRAYQHLSRYECKEAIDCLISLKPQHYSTGWVLGHIAKAYFENGKYEDAVKFYELMRHVEPHRVDGLEWMSTALWHLQKEVELSALSDDLIRTERNHVSTWITIGNCFSLHKEHESAIKFFKRAIQVAPSYAYGYTLLGHEHVATEELEKAMRCFRNASRIDPRHYNAWYGMGMIYYKQESFQKAEVYYRKALATHPNNSVLLCHLGVVQHALGETDRALCTFAKALSLNPDDPLSRFHRASVLFAANRLEQALDELEELKQIVPKESLVYFLIAKVYSKRGDTHKALLHFSWATDLDPKGANNQIKESIEPVLSRSIASMVNTNGDFSAGTLGNSQLEAVDESSRLQVEDGMDVSAMGDSEAAV